MGQAKAVEGLRSGGGVGTGSSLVWSGRTIKERGNIYGGAGLDPEGLQGLCLRPPAALGALWLHQVQSSSVP